MYRIERYEGNEPYIFVSCASSNDSAVMQIITQLNNAGYRVWYIAQDDPNAENSEMIAGKIKNCNCFLALMTPDYPASNSCMDALEYARIIDKTRLLAYLSPVTLSDGMQMNLSRVHAIHRHSCANDNAFYLKLLQTEEIRSCCSYQPQEEPPAEEEPVPSSFLGRVRKTFLNAIQPVNNPTEDSPKAPVAPSVQPDENKEESAEAAPPVSAEDAEKALLLERTLHNFSIPAKVRYVFHGPQITRFAVKLADGVNVHRLSNLTKNLAMAMNTIHISLHFPINHPSLVGIDIPNDKLSIVTLKEVLESEPMQSTDSPTAVAIGKDVMNQPVICDLARLTHLLLAGCTGSGKSVCLHSIIMSLLQRATPEQVRLLLIDPTQIEFQCYNGIPHLLTEVITDPAQAIAALDWVLQEMLNRYRIFQKTCVRNIEGYNKKADNEASRLPRIVVIIDELSALMMHDRKQTEDFFMRLQALARGAGIHLIAATQRPSVNIITGIVKDTFSNRIAFAVTNGIDSRTILDCTGAEKLLCCGDMLYQPSTELSPFRVQGCYASMDEIEAVTAHLKENTVCGYDSNVLEYISESMKKNAPVTAEDEFPPRTDEDILRLAIETALAEGMISISMLRRRLGIGHSRAERMIDQMIKMGIVEDNDTPRPKKTLITHEEYLKMKKEQE